MRVSQQHFLPRNSMSVDPNEISISHQTERSDWRRAAHVRESRRRRRFHMSRSAGSAGPQRDARHV